MVTHFIKLNGCHKNKPIFIAMWETKNTSIMKRYMIIKQIVPKC